jgi:hypothetical protein
MAGKPKSGKTQDAPKKRGRPNTYNPKYNAQVTKLCLLGATDAELARFFEVSETTIHTWKKDYPEFVEALKKGKEQADAQVSKSLYQRAIGYSHKEEKIFCQEGEIIRAETIKHYPPEVIACIFWLKNRRPDLWRDKPRENQTDAEEIKRVVGDLYAQLYNTSGATEESKKDSDDTE